jgi:hypothetical protein
MAQARSREQIAFACQKRVSSEVWKIMKRSRYILAGLIALFLLLLIPPSQNEFPLQRPSESPFLWDQDAIWQRLEAEFQKARKMDPEVLASTIRARKIEADQILQTYEHSVTGPADPIYFELERSFFGIAPLIAASTDPSDWHIQYYNRVRSKIKEDSISWDMKSSRSRNALYRILYGMRAAVEEIMIQSDRDQADSTFFVQDERSAAPSVEILGVTVHSGDLLVSRGGREMSAFISRGNDYPGNFSHVAIIYIDEKTNNAFIIQSLIDNGVVIDTLDSYLNDHMLRLMVLRPRADLPEIKVNPLVPHLAAKFMFQEASERHIPYDYKMDYFDSSAMYCSEVGSYAYQQFGIKLWESESTVSSDGIVNWLVNFGVEYFLNQLPSDLEYDPSLSVVAEWRDYELLVKDHVDNAVMDALIGRANEGQELGYELWKLPVVRVLKFYSVVMSSIGREGIVPDGMSVLTVLTSGDFERRFQGTKDLTMRKVDEFEKQEGYLPPYWQISGMAESSYLTE